MCGKSQPRGADARGETVPVSGKKGAWFPYYFLVLAHYAQEQNVIAK